MGRYRKGRQGDPRELQKLSLGPWAVHTAWGLRILTHEAARKQGGLTLEAQCCQRGRVRVPAELSPSGSGG